MEDIVDLAAKFMDDSECGLMVQALIEKIMELRASEDALVTTANYSIDVQRNELVRQRETIDSLKSSLVGARSIHQHVSEFHRVYGQPILDKPQVPSESVVRLRASLIAEEFIEMLDAMFDIDESVIRNKIMGIVNMAKVDVDLPELVDAWGDLDYVVEGSRLAFGVDGLPIANEIQRSNLSKLGEDGKPIKRADGKIMKGPNFTPPDIAGELRRQGWEG